MSRQSGGVRSNEEWISALRSSNREELELAHRDLAAYLHKVAINYLRRRQAQANPMILATFGLEELEALAQDFVQDVLEKMVRDNYALLDKFEGRGAFLSWMAAVIIYLIAEELRRAEWDRKIRPGSGDDEQISEDSDNLEERELSEAMQNCLEKLSENRRIAILSRVVSEHTIEEIKNEMNKTEAAVYSLLSRARRDLRKCLQAEGPS